MEFGRIEQLDSVDYRLPDDGYYTQKILSGKKENDCKFHVGLSRWGLKEWVGNFYPPMLKERDFLTEYAKHYNTIELNATFFRIQPQHVVESWKHKIEESGNQLFQFMAKAYKPITHNYQLASCGSELNLFFDSIRPLQPYLGPVFFQLSERFGPDYLDRLQPFIEKLPTEFEYYFEVRNKDWFNHPGTSREYFQLLTDNRIGTIISDTSGRRDAVHMEITNNKLFLRFVGNGGAYWSSDYNRIDSWIDRIELWLSKGLQEVYFFVHQYEEIDSPKLADYVKEKINQRFSVEL